MWPGAFRILYVALCLSILAQHAAAQQAAPLQAPTGGLQTQGTEPAYGQPVQPAPTLEPLLSREDQMARDARLLAEQQKNAAQNTSQNAPQNTAPTASAPVATTQPPQQQQLVPQDGNILPQLPPQQQQTTQQPQAMPQQVMQQPAVVEQQPAPQPQTPPQTATRSTAPAQPAASVTNTAGFSPNAAADNKLPMTSGMVPVTQDQMLQAQMAQTNPGMDMSINPDLVGGLNYDPNLPPGPNNPVPYEVQLEQRTQEIQQKARAQAFEQAKRSSLPMETYEIRDVLSRLKDTQEAIQTPARPAPKVGNVIKTISTDPSARPQTVHLAAGNVTTLNIVDITGEPWPIVDIGFGGTFDVKPPEPGGHVIRITPLRDFARGNLVVRLLKLTTPLTFSLQAGGNTVNYRFDARIPEYGPNAKMPLIDNGIQAVAGDKVTTSFLEGVPPNGSEKMKIDGIDARTTAYKYSGAMYVRTPLTLLSPAWNGSATSADGMNVYVLNDAPVLLLSDKGSLVRAKVTDGKKTTMGF